MSPTKKGIFPEFEITEQHHELQCSGPNSLVSWQVIQKTAELYEKKSAEIAARLDTLKEKQDSEKRKLFLELIEEIMDNLDRALPNLEEKKFDQAVLRWVKRLNGIRRKMEEILAREQVVPIDMLSAPPGLVTADGVEDRDDVPDGTILSVNWRGYLWKGEMLRKASVIVARNDGDSTGERAHTDADGGNGSWQK